MEDLNWDAFAYRNSKNKSDAFEALSKDFFRFYFFDKDTNIQQKANHPGVEVYPIYSEKVGKTISFQSKYFKVLFDYEQLEKSMKMAIKHYRDELDTIYLFSNKDPNQECESYTKIEKMLQEYNIELEPITNQGLFDLIEQNNYADIYYKYFTDKFDFSKIKKQTCELVTYYIERRITPFVEQDELDTMTLVEKMRLSKSITTNNVLNCNENILLLSAAGFGKTQVLQDMTNQLNQSTDYFAFYVQLLHYTGQALEKLVPHGYKKVLEDKREALVFVLDGYDEIAEIHRADFLRNLGSFMSQNNDVRIILSSRLNFYKASQFPTNFIPYELVNFTIKEETELVSRLKIDNRNLQNEIRSKGLINLLATPFYFLHALKLFQKQGELPERSKFTTTLISASFTFDQQKYELTKGLEEEKSKLYNILQTIGFAMEMLEKNYLTQKEIHDMFKEEDIQLLEYSSLIVKSDKKYVFVHKNFGEYLAAEKLRGLNFAQIKNLITYTHDREQIKESLLATVVVLIAITEDEQLKKKLVEMVPPASIFSFDSEMLEYERISLFKRAFEFYEQQRMFQPWYRRLSGGHVNQFCEREVITYLLDKIVVNEHASIVYAGLFTLRVFNNFGTEAVNVKQQLMNVCRAKNFENMQKVWALQILANQKLIDNTELLEVIASNNENEDSFLRKAYYYVLNHLGLSLDNIQIVYNRFDQSNNPFTLNTKPNIMIDGKEHAEFIKLFSTVQDANTAKDMLCFFAKNTYAFSSLHPYDALENFLQTLCKFYEEDVANINLIYEFCQICDKYYEFINESTDMLRDNNILIPVFDKYLRNFVEMKNNSFLRNLVNESQCVDYFLETYESFNNWVEVGEYILSYSEVEKKKLLVKLNKLIFDQTGEDILAEVEQEKLRFQRVIEPGKTKQAFFDCLFSQETFLMSFTELQKRVGTKELTREQLKTLMPNFFRHNDKLRWMKDFLVYNFSDEKLINMDAVLAQSFDSILLWEVCEMLRNDTNLHVSEGQIKILEQTCLNTLKTVSFKECIKPLNEKHNRFIMKDQYSCTVIALWSLRHRFEFKFSDDILLDMLVVDFGKNYNHGKNGISYIKDEVLPSKVQERIVANIKSIEMKGDVLKNHITYCITHKIHGLSSAFDYMMFDSNTKRWSDKNDVITYLVFDLSYIELLNRYIEKVDTNVKNEIFTQIIADKKLTVAEKQLVVDYLNKLLEQEEEENIKLSYAEYLIKLNQKSGLQYYYQVLSKNTGVTKLRDAGAAFVAIKNIELLDDVIKIFKLRLLGVFTDDFDYLHQGCRSAIYNIAFSDLTADSDLITINKIEDWIKADFDAQYIGNLHYLLEEIKSENNRRRDVPFTLDEVIKLMNGSRKPPKEKIII
jgi:hypothetical protein